MVFCGPHLARKHAFGVNDVPLSGPATPGVNFINVLRTAFTHVDPECAKKDVKSAVSFGTFGNYERKSCT